MSPLTAARIFESDENIIDIVGSSERLVDRVSPWSTAETGALTFLSKPPAPDLVSQRRPAGITLICAAPPEISGLDITYLIARNPRLSFMRATSRFFSPPLPSPGVHPTAVIDASATIDPTAYIGPGVVVGARSSVGARSVLHANVVLYDDVKIGRRVVIHGGSVIGADGFGYERNEAGALEKFPHIGGVTILDDVEIGSNTSIDRGTLQDTLICQRARIDNQVHIAHNVVVGQDVAVIAQAMIGGSVRIGDRAWIAPSATVMNKADIGSDATVGLGAVVVKTVMDGQTVMGAPAVPDHEFRATRAALKALTTT